MSVKDRLKTYIKHCGLGVSNFEKSINVSNGYVNNMSKSIGIDKLELILEKYSNLSLEWLITGKGEMLKEIPIQNENSSDLLEKIKTLEEQNDLLRENLALYKDRCEIYKEEIAELKGTPPDRSQTA
ncbi:hypothetical protein [Flavobacterium hydatis]|jgi:hypothetical protein|uniref:HTH cro/C1-type domain-containing protein n=1 Tax=Flavobacterium hydatis TaxID=991 RepID=A0ABX4BZJ5_FLAHY|nr:hypothetical protein [Flavobacterium hydatis]OXA85034.1 hypothetical protein B0A62_24705 [Flavobacterium hydatis]